MCSGSAVRGDGADGFGGCGDGRGVFARLTAGAGAVLGSPGQVCFCEIDGRVLGGMQFGDSCAAATVHALAFRYLGSMLV